jgi:hypothetical protein
MKPAAGKQESHQLSIGARVQNVSVPHLIDSI